MESTIRREHSAPPHFDMILVGLVTFYQAANLINSHVIPRGNNQLAPPPLSQSSDNVGTMKVFVIGKDAQKVMKVDSVMYCLLLYLISRV